MPHNLDIIKHTFEKMLDHIIPEDALPEKRLYDAARYSLLGGGKRVRPLLALAVVADFGGSLEQAYLPASALELVHTSSLIHDDLPCMDDDALRRGKKTLHLAFSESTALLTGDFLLTYPFELLAKSTLPLESKIRLITSLCQGIGNKGMIGGQLLDLEAHHDLFLIHSMKTGALIEASLEFGAILSNVSKDVENTLLLFGKKIGLAFQIADDLLEQISPPEILGKDAQSDKKNKKSTYFTLFGKEGCEEKLAQLYDEARSLIGSQNLILNTLLDQLIIRNA